jgi:adenylate cyclase
MSGDPDQEYVADGLTENIITGLSRFRDLFVIARHSSFAYKGKAVKIPNVCRELGIRYVLEGSVQMASGRVRIAAQFIDGMTDHHLWAERYDRKVEDIFAVQDEVTETIVGTLATSYGGRLRKAWSARSDGSGAHNLRAIDYFQLGQEFLGHFTREDNVRAREFFRKAADLDPGYAKPCSKIAWTNIIDVMFGWSENPAASLAIAVESATEAIRRDDDEAWGHWALGGYYLFGLQEHDRAVTELQKAVELNPNDADVITDLGLFLSYAGRPREGLGWALKAMRLNPHYHDWYVMHLGQIYYDARCYEEAIATFRSLSAVDTAMIELYVAASHVALGNIGDAEKAVKRALELDPGATIGQWTEPARAPYKEISDLEHFAADLRKAGLPE